MIKINVTNRSGQRSEIETTEGISLMEALREAGFDELMALCGGCCSCATCHVYLDQDCSDDLASMSAEESDLLDSSEHRIQASRLSCQVLLKRDHDGLRLRIAPED